MKRPSRGDKRFRAGVGAVIVNSSGQVLALERRDVAGAWQLPQGGVKRGETLDRALFREVREETGLYARHLAKTFEVPVWMGYELPRDLRSRKIGRGQVHKWFFLRLVGDERAIKLKRNGEFKAWRWCDFAELTASVIEFRRPVYVELVRIAAGQDAR